MDYIAERIAQQFHASEARAALVRTRLSSATSLLRQKGANRIWRSGSMARGDRPHIGSDVDLAVEGLPASGLIRTLLDIEWVLGIRVDLIRLEEASASLCARIADEGIELSVSQ